MGRKQTRLRKTRGGRLTMFALWTIDDWEAFIVLTRTIIEQLRQTSFEALKEKVLRTLSERSEQMMTAPETHNEATEHEAQPTETEQTPTTEQPEPETPPVIHMPLDMQVGFLLSTVFKHLTRIARLFELLCEIYPDLRADLGPELYEWIRELDRDNKAGFGFSILEGEENEPV